MKADTKENAEVSIQNSEKETMAWHHKGLKEEVKKKEKEIDGLKSHIIEYEREIAKLREKLKYVKEGISQSSISDEEHKDEASWKETCIVLSSIYV